MGKFTQFLFVLFNVFVLWISNREVKPQQKQNLFTSLHSLLLSSSMAKLRTAIDSSFWDLNISSPQNLDGWAKFVPGDPIPLDASVSSRLFRHQQLPHITPHFPFGIIPSLVPSPKKDHGSFSLQSLLLDFTGPRW